MSSNRINKLALGLVVISLVVTAFASAGSAWADTPGTNTLDIRGSTTLFPIVDSAKDMFISDSPSTVFSISQGGSGVGQSWILAGVIDIAMSSSSCKDSNAGLNGAPPAAYTCAQLTQHTIGRDGIALIVKNGSCMANSTKQLTMDQVANIYSGQITDWNDVFSNCPDGSTIIPRARATTSGTYASFIDIVKAYGTPNKLSSTNEAATITASGYPRLEANQNVNDAIVGDTTGRMIGYVGLAFDANVTDMKIAKTSSGPWVDANVANVSNGSYGLGRNLYLFRLPTAKQRILDYVAWMFSTKGQAVVQDVGYVPVGVVAKDYDVNGDQGVNVGDLVAVGGVWNQSGPRAWWIRQDGNRDATISVGDLVFIGSHWNETY